jgi:xylan 1,4-beta-xylosidase
MLLLVLNLAFLLYFTSARQVNVSVDASNIIGDLPPTARFFGADEPNQATYPDGRALIHDLGNLGPHQTYFRTHNLLTTCDPPDNTSPHRLKWGCTNVYTVDDEGNPIYNFAILDGIFDTYLENGVKPYAQASFMPKALSTHPEPYTFYFDASSDYNEIYVGWSYPPTSWSKWGELIYQWVKHCVERYGKAEVESWYWEIWNEPNIPYWNGTQVQYFTLYDYAVDGILRALPTATVGGPEVAGGPDGDWLGLFLDHTINGQNNATGGKGAPLDFISFHAKGSPTYINATKNVPGHLQMNMSAELTNVDDAFVVIHNYSTLNNLPVFIGEDDPDSCAACISPEVDYRNGLIYPSYTAAVFTREIDLAVKYNINLTGTLTWAFEFDDHPYFDNFRVLATNKINKPIFNIFKMFGKMQAKRLDATSTGQYPLESVVTGSIRGDSDVGVLASVDEDASMMAVMIWNYHDDDLPKADAQISFAVSSAFPGCKELKMTHYRIDQSHSNAYAAWLAMGSPQNPTSQQTETLKAAAVLQMLSEPTTIQVKESNVALQFDLPIHSISLLILEK